MDKYRVTYVESILREVVVEADDAQHAEDIAHDQQDEAQHHHAIDVWNDDWQAEEYKASPRFNRFCFECGEPRT